MRKTKERTRRVHAQPRSKADRAAAADERRGLRGSKFDGGAASVTFLVGVLISTFLFFVNPMPQSFEAYTLTNAAVLLWIPLSIILLFFRHEPSQFGMAAGDKKFGLKFTVAAIIVMLPVVFIASQMAGFREFYGGRLVQWLGMTGSACRYDLMHPLFSRTHQVIGYPLVVRQFPFVVLYPHSISLPLGLIYYELAMGFYMFCWEFFFRGFILFGLARSRYLGNVGAVILQTIPFALLHWSLRPGASKPEAEIISAIFGGIALGMLAIKTRSFFYGFLIHWSISIAMDIFVIAPQLFKL